MHVTKANSLTLDPTQHPTKNFITPNISQNSKIRITSRTQIQKCTDHKTRKMKLNQGKLENTRFRPKYLEEKKLRNERLYQLLGAYIHRNRVKISSNLSSLPPSEEVESVLPVETDFFCSL